MENVLNNINNLKKKVSEEYQSKYSLSLAFILLFLNFKCRKLG